MEVITNIDADHMDTYQHDMARLKQAFVQFTQRMPFYGIAILCIDDANVRDIVPFVSQPILRYGFSDDADIRASDVVAIGTQMEFTVHRKTIRRHGVQPGPLKIRLNLPGKHNVLNALAAIGIATELGVSDEAIMKALAQFGGVGRRFQHYGEIKAKGGGQFTLIDDYGHHPVEMNAILSAARGAYPKRRLVLAFQPHRFTRTRDCFGDFVQVLGQFDTVVLTNVYPAGEARIPGADSKALIKALGKTIPAQLVEQVNEMPKVLSSLLHDGDVLITMGAGSISQLPHAIVELQHG
jgi:UDP-N-acetylmuramate--alanine ligase